MEHLTEFCILTLATWRLASLFSTEDGPLDVFARLRHLMGVRHDDHGVPVGTNAFSKGLVCLWCCSIWIGVFWAGLYYLWGDSVWIALPFALSAGAIAIERWNNV